MGEALTYRPVICGHRRFRSITWLISAFGLALLIFAALGAGSASALSTHPFIGGFGPDGTEGSDFATIGGVAIDQSTGSFYVEDSSGTLFKFGPEGEEREFEALGSNELTGLGLRFSEPGINQVAVNSTTHDIYVVENATGTNRIAVFHANGEPGEFSSLSSNKLEGFGELCGATVDANGAIYATDFFSGVTVYSSAGDPLASYPMSAACGAAVAQDGTLYVNQYGGQVVKLSPSAFPVTNTTTYTEEGPIEAGPNYGVTVDPISNSIYFNKGKGLVQRSSSGSLIARFADSGEAQIAGSEGVAVLGSADLLFAGDQTSKHIKRYGPLEPLPPAVEGQWAGPVGPTEATLHAEVNAKGLPSTYSFEYGPEDCSLSVCHSTPELPLGSSEAAIKVAARIEGLLPQTIYHFRVKVTSELSPVFGPDETFETPAEFGADSALLDDRGYELVSPVDDGGAEFGVPFPAGGFINGSVKPQRAAEDGQSVAYASFTAFGDPAGAPPASYYLSRRSLQGWTTENITPADNPGGLIGPIRSFAPDLSYSGVVSIGHQLTSDAVPGYANLYLRNNESRTLLTLTTEAPQFTSPSQFCINFIGASEEADHVIFTANGGLTSDAPASPEEAPNLYDWSAASGLSLVNVFPDGTPAVPKSFGGFGSGPSECFISNAAITRNAISNNGQYIFWTYRPFGSQRELFVRVNDAETIQLDESQGGPDLSGGGEFLTASTNGKHVFFTNQQRLLPGASANDLYEYNLETTELKDLTLDGNPAEVQGILGASEDGSYLYFVARGALASGAIPSANNLYVWHEGAIVFIGSLSPEDESDWSTQFAEQTARVVPSGKYVVFQSVKSLTGYDNEIGGSATCRLTLEGAPVGGRGCSEVFLYNATSGELSCASCNPNGTSPSALPPPKGEAMNSLPKWSTPFEQPRYLSDDGSRLFFESYEALVLRDTNQRKDIYEFEQLGAGSCTEATAAFSQRNNGCIQLLSTGTGSDESYFLDASKAGSDAFLVTRQPLVSGDQDNRYDVYDARVSGGFPGPSQPPPPCAGENCRPSAIGQSGDSIPGSSVFEGPGNVKPKVKCPKPKVKRNGRCVKRHKHRHKHRRSRLGAGMHDSGHHGSRRVSK